MLSRFRRAALNPEQLSDLLQAPECRALNFSRFPQGIDNVHIDVAFDDDFVEKAQHYVSTLLRDDVKKNYWNRPDKSSSNEAQDVFRAAYVEVTRAAVTRARKQGRPEQAQLHQLAVVKLIIWAVDTALAELRQELDDARALSAGQQSGRALQVHQQIVSLARHEASIRFRALSAAMRGVLRFDQMEARRIRQSVLGVSWPVAEDMLASPLWQLGGLNNIESVVTQTPFLFVQPEHAQKLNRCILDALGGCLSEPPELPVSKAEDTPPTLSVEEANELLGYAELKQFAKQLISEAELVMGNTHGLDNAVAVKTLLGGEGASWPAQPPALLNHVDSKALGAQQKGWIKALRQGLKSQGLLQLIESSYRLRDIYPLLRRGDCAELVFGYLHGDFNRKEFVKRLDALTSVDDAEALASRVEQLDQQQQQSGQLAGERLIVRCVGDFLQFRYQLKLGVWLFDGLREMRLLSRQEDKALSESNRLLQRFSLQVAEQSVGRVLGHVIIKADVRGSSKLTARMQQQKLNPAAYFSRNFYDPITALLRDFGAEKVFIEGDAIILCLLKDEGGDEGLMVIARACGLARKILEVVEAKNDESRRMGLPTLELGLGIAYASEAPTYLYDEGHRITISAAINRADRMSSCDATLRNLCAERWNLEKGVEVAVPVYGQNQAKSDAEHLVRFNVNGVELEAGAFYQLDAEVKLHRFSMAWHTGEQDVFHVALYPDLKGNSHLLVIREAPVRLWVGQELIAEQSDGRRFYQVVTETSQIEKVKRALKGAKKRLNR